MRDAALYHHASCVAWQGRGVMVRGASGAGKSSVALQLIRRGWMLVADDQVKLDALDNTLYAAPPPSLAGLLEIRGVGIVRLPYRLQVPVAMVVDLVAQDAVPRMPEPNRVAIVHGSVAVPAIELFAFDPLIADKILLAMTGCLAHS